jgi:hypothetical protein
MSTPFLHHKNYYDRKYNTHHYTSSPSPVFFSLLIHHHSIHQTSLKENINSIMTKTAAPSSLSSTLSLSGRRQRFLLLSRLPIVIVATLVFIIYDDAIHDTGCSAFTPNSAIITTVSKKNDLSPSSSSSSSFPLFGTTVGKSHGSTSATTTTPPCYYPTSFVGTTTNNNNPVVDREQYAIQKAVSFAYGDDYDHDDDLLLHGDSTLQYWPIEEAKFWFNEVSALLTQRQHQHESNSPNALSVVLRDDNATVPMGDIVTRLQSKIERHERRIAKRKGYVVCLYVFEQNRVPLAKHRTVYIYRFLMCVWASICGIVDVLMNVFFTPCCGVCEIPLEPKKLNFLLLYRL